MSAMAPGHARLPQSSRRHMRGGIPRILSDGIIVDEE